MADKLPLIDWLKVTGDYRLKLGFSDGAVGEWSFDRLAADPRPIAVPFRDRQFFASVYLELGALTWPNGYDLSPVALYREMKNGGALSFDTARAA